jgi:membrane associated rhomboid family serine protease
MAYYEKEYKRQLLPTQGNSALITLIAINLIIFVILAFFRAVSFLRYDEPSAAIQAFNTNILRWFTLPADMSELGSRPWTVISHMFSEINFWRIFANMIWLWCFGYIMQDLTGNRKIIPVYLYGALVGAIAFVLAYNFLPALQDQLSVATSMGASAGVMAVAVATTMVAPNYRIFPMLRGGIPLWVLTSLYVLIDLTTIPGNNTGVRITHLAGAVTGFLFMFSFKKGFDWSEWMNNVWDWFDNLFNPDKARKPQQFKDELFYKSTTRPYKKTPNVTEQRIDEILDKINQRGYNSLTEDEKDLLKRASKEGL